MDSYSSTRSVRPSYRKVSNALRETPVAIVQEHPEYRPTLKQVNDEIQLRLLNTSTIGRTTFANVLTGQTNNVLKKLEDTPHDRKSESLKDDRFTFADWIMKIV